MLPKERDCSFMNGFLDLLNNNLLIITAIAWFAAQTLKFFIHSAIERKFSFSRFFGDGGMPSAHTASVVSLATAAGWEYGLGSAAFAISALFAIVVMKDAVGVRRETGKHALVIKQIANLYNAMFLEKDEAVKTEKLKEFVGHTKTQVFFGALVGIIVAICAMLIMKVGYGQFTV